MFGKQINPGLTGKLRTLVRVNDLGFPMSSNGLTQNLQRVFTIQRVKKTPTHYVSAVHINDSCQVQKTTFHGDIGNIYRPNLIRMRNLELTKFVRMNVPGDPQLTHVTLRVNGHNPHFAKEPSNSFGSHQNIESQHKIHHLFNALSRMLQMFLIHQSHDLQVLWLFFHSLVKQVATMNPQQLALPTLAQIGPYRDDFFEVFKIPSCSEARLQKSTSISRRPIFSYKAFSRLAASSSGALVEKISALRATNSRFQLDIIWGWTSKRLANSLSVSASLIASRATLALKAALCLVLLFLVILVNLIVVFKLNQWSEF